MDMCTDLGRSGAAGDDSVGEPISQPIGHKSHHPPSHSSLSNEGPASTTDELPPAPIPLVDPWRGRLRRVVIEDEDSSLDSPSSGSEGDGDNEEELTSSESEGEDGLTAWDWIGGVGEQQAMEIGAS